MREITKIIFVPVDEKLMEFRLTKLDAFSGVSLLRILSRLPEQGDGRLSSAEQGKASSHSSEQWDGSPRSTNVELEDCPRRSACPAANAAPRSDIFKHFLSSLPESDLRSLMTVCLEHTEVLLPAGWIPVLTRGEWSFPEISHDTATCLKLALEEAVWTLEGFFGEGASGSRPETQAT